MVVKEYTAQNISSESSLYSKENEEDLAFKSDFQEDKVYSSAYNKSSPQKSSINNTRKSVVVEEEMLNISNSVPGSHQMHLSQQSPLKNTRRRSLFKFGLEEDIANLSEDSLSEQVLEKKKQDFDLVSRDFLISPVKKSLKFISKSERNIQYLTPGYKMLKQEENSSIKKQEESNSKRKRRSFDDKSPPRRHQLFRLPVSKGDLVDSGIFDSNDINDNSKINSKSIANVSFPFDIENIEQKEE